MTTPTPACSGATTRSLCSQGLLPVWHRSVCEDLANLVEELAEEQESWLLLAPAHVRQVYNRGQEKTQLHLLALTWRLDLLQFPGRRQLVTELFWGFPLLGPLTPGTGWAPRSDSKYSRPLSRSDFASANREHVRSVATSLRPSEHSATMFEENPRRVQARPSVRAASAKSASFARHFGLRLTRVPGRPVRQGAPRR